MRIRAHSRLAQERHFRYDSLMLTLYKRAMPGAHQRMKPTFAAAGASSCLARLTMKKVSIPLFALLISVVSFAVEPAKVDLNQLFREVRVVVRRYYPDATCHLVDNRIHFESQSRIYVVHEALKTGEWQDPWEERGPKKDGIVGEIHFQEGPYQGAAMLPAAFDKRYFTVWVSAPYSEKLNSHLHVSIKVPSKFPRPFYDDLMKVLSKFDQYVSRSAG